MAMSPLDRAKAAIAAEIGVSSAPIEAFALADGRMIPTANIIRAVLTAIRKPSEAMEDAVDRYAEEIHAQYDIGPDKIWEIMIDAALAE